MAGEMHTAGPWEMQSTIREGHEQGVMIVADNLGGLVGAALPWPTEVDSGDFSRVEANARVMTAAPTLLEALKNMLPGNLALGNDAWPDDTIVPIDFTLGELRAARAAILLATPASLSAEGER